MSVYDLTVVGVNSPATNDYEIKELRVTDNQLVAVVEVESELYNLPHDMTETVTTTKRVKTKEKTDEPVMEIKSVQKPLLDAEGNHVHYYPSTISYEQVEIGIDENDEPIYETVEVETVSETPIYCYVTEEVEEHTGEYWIDVEEVEEICTCEIEQIMEDDERWNEDLECVMVEKEIVLD